VTTTPVKASPSRDPVVDVSSWNKSDVQNWLEKNDLTQLQFWYDTNHCLRRLVNNTLCLKNDTKNDTDVQSHPHSPDVGGSEQNRSVIANVQSDDLWPSRMHAATHILQEKTHVCGVLKRHNFRVHVSLGSVETLVRRGGIINHHSLSATSLPKITEIG